MKRFLSLVTILTIVLGISFAYAGDKDKKTSAKSKSCCSEMTSAKNTKDAGCSEMTSAKSAKDACCASMTSAKAKGEVSKSDVSMTSKASMKDGCCAGGTKAKMSKEDCQKACPGMKAEKTSDAKGTTD